jgi:hypothetical protein
MQLLEKYKEKFDVSSMALRPDVSLSGSQFINVFDKQGPRAKGYFSVQENW